jgi:hypothetical protein
MSQRTLIGGLVGLAGSAAVAWGIHGLMLIGNCGGDGAPPCPPEATPYFVAVAVGLPAAILAGIFGRTITTFAIFPAVAVGALWAGMDLTGGARATALLLGGIFGAVSLAPFALLPLQRRKRRRAMRLITEGATAIGTVTSIRDTGVTINKNPRVTLTYRIEPEDGSLPFDGEKTMVVSRVHLPQQGQRYPIWYDRQDRSQFAIGTKVDDTAAPEVRRLFEKAAAGAPGVPFGATEALAGGGATDPLDRLAKLNELRLAGALTEEEFQSQKARILAAG